MSFVVGVEDLEAQVGYHAKYLVLRGSNKFSADFSNSTVGKRLVVNLSTDTVSSLENDDRLVSMEEISSSCETCQSGSNHYYINGFGYCCGGT